MKKIVIGSVFLLSGLLLTVGIILSASICLPHLTAWSTEYPSRLFFLIFAGKSKFNDGAEGLNLGIFFVVGVLMLLGGLWILLKEYFSTEDKKL